MADSLGSTGDVRDAGDWAGAVRRPPSGKRGVFLHARLVELGGSGIRVRRLGGSRAGEVRLSRFLRNPAVSVAEMAAQAGARTAERCAGRHVLAIQDTTVVRSAGGGGLFLHATLAVDARDGAILGLVDGRFLARTGGTRAARKDKPVAEKESRRWLDGAERAAAVCRAAERVTVICDREGDIFEAFARRPDGVDLLVRAAQDRSLGKDGRLFAKADSLPEAGRARLALPAKPGRKAREATLALRFGQVALQPPQTRRGGERSPPQRLNLVDLRELDPPAGEPAIHWRLLTTRPVQSATDAVAIGDLYRRRWAIEQLFRTLKTQGFDIEGLRIEDDRPRSNLVMAALVAAVTIQQLVHARDGAPDGAPPRPMTDAFDPADRRLLEAYCAKLEGRTERQKNPHPKGSLAYAAWICARLGGWTGYYGKPGPIVMLEGWLRFQAAKHGLALLNHATQNV